MTFSYVLGALQSLQRYVIEAGETMKVLKLYSSSTYITNFSLLQSTTSALQ